MKNFKVDLFVEDIGEEMGLKYYTEDSLKHSILSSLSEDVCIKYIYVQEIK